MEGCRGRLSQNHGPRVKIKGSFRRVPEFHWEIEGAVWGPGWVREIPVLTKDSEWHLFPHTTCNRIISCSPLMATGICISHKYSQALDISLTQLSEFLILSQGSDCPLVMPQVVAIVEIFRPGCNDLCHCAAVWLWPSCNND